MFAYVGISPSPPPRQTGLFAVATRVPSLWSHRQAECELRGTFSQTGATRAQPGTSSLRAIIYMDEIYGYFPPTAKPPSKKPMLTLLKQARA